MELWSKNEPSVDLGTRHTHSDIDLIVEIYDRVRLENVVGDLSREVNTTKLLLGVSPSKAEAMGMDTGDRRGWD